MEITLSRSFNYMMVLVLSLVSFSVMADDDDDTLIFKHGIVLKIDGQKYYLHGPADGPNGEMDVPGHVWAKVGEKKLVGKHYNTGPSGAAQWWSSDAPDGELLYIVDARLDVWSEKKSLQYFLKGYTHYHHLVSMADGSMHPKKVLWLKHVATTRFSLDGGPHPELSHDVKPGVDFEFVPNWSTPYMPGHQHMGN